MKFLRRFLAWRTRSPGADSAAHRFVLPAGTIARFVFEKRKLFENGTPKPHVFEQERHPTLNRLETSVCGTNGVAEPRLWHIGSTIRNPKQAIAAVEVAVSSVGKAGLQCEAAPEENYAEHGVIIGWDESDKDTRMSAQVELAAAHTAVRRPTPTPACH